MAKVVGFLACMAVIAFFYVLSIKKQKQGQGDKKDRRHETVQDLLEYEKMDENGLVKLKSGTYSLVLEVQQINMRLKNLSECNSIWLKFRTLVNSIGIHKTLLVQSHYLNMEDYLEDYRRQSNEIEWLTPQLRKSAEHVTKHLISMSEKKTRDYRSYVILRFNPYRDGTDAGISSGNKSIDDLFASIKGAAAQMSSEEAEDMARNVLDEVADLVYQLYESMGIRVNRLNRVGVHNMLFTTLNRDLSLIQSIYEASNAHSFSEFKQSLTPHLVEKDVSEELNWSDQEVAVSHE